MQIKTNWLHQCRQCAVNVSLGRCASSPWRVVVNCHYFLLAVILDWINGSQIVLEHLKGTCLRMAYGILKKWWFDIEVYPSSLKRFLYVPSGRCFNLPRNVYTGGCYTKCSIPLCLHLQTMYSYGSPLSNETKKAPVILLWHRYVIAKYPKCSWSIIVHENIVLKIIGT